MMTDAEIRTWEFLMDGKWRGGDEVVEYVNTGVEDDFILLAGLRTAMATAPRRKIGESGVYYPGRGESLSLLGSVLEGMLDGGKDEWVGDEECDGETPETEVIQMPDPREVPGRESGVGAGGGVSGGPAEIDEGGPVVS